MVEPSFPRTTRAAYDCVAADYAERFHGELADVPLDRAPLAALAELVQAAMPARSPTSVAGPAT
jgi:hypothetical protein